QRARGAAVTIRMMGPSTLARAASPELVLDDATAGTLLLRLSGAWTTAAGRPAVGEVDRRLTSPQAPRRVTFDAAGLDEWDSGLLTFLLRVIALAERHGIAVDRQGLPEGVRRLLALATAVPERKDTAGAARRPSLLARIGTGALQTAG